MTMKLQLSTTSPICAARRRILRVATSAVLAAALLLTPTAAFAGTIDSGSDFDCGNDYPVVRSVTKGTLWVAARTWNYPFAYTTLRSENLSSSVWSTRYSSAANQGHKIDWVVTATTSVSTSGTYAYCV